MSNNYKPDVWVKIGNELNFLDGDVDWMSSGPGSNVMSVKFAFLPILLLSLGVLVFLVLFLLKFFSSFCCEITCRPKIAPHEDLQKIHKKIDGQISTMSKLYYTLVLGILCATQLIAIQHDYLMKGTKGMQTFVADLSGIFNDLDKAATNLDESSQSIADTISGASDCINNLDASSLSQSSGLFVEEISPTRNVFVRLGKYLDQGLSNSTYLETFTWGSYGIMIIFASLLGYMNYQRSTCGVKFFTFLAGIAYFVTLALGIVFLCITMVLANTCMDPYQELLDSAPDSVSDNLAYYFTCEGANTLFAESDAAKASIANLQSSVASIKSTGGSCATNSGLLYLESELIKANDYIVDAEESVPCTEVRESLSTFIGTSLCTQLYRCNGALWVCFQASSLLIFMLVVIGTINSQYYRSEDRRKIAANVMDLDGIIPDAASAEEGYPQHYDSSWGQGEELKPSRKKRLRRQEAKDDDGAFF
jgi:hypothetical protein